MKLQLGRCTLLGLSDGDFRPPRQFLGDEAHAALAGPDGVPHLPIGAFLVPGDEPVLIDAGLGPDLDSRWMTGGSLPSQQARQTPNVAQLEAFLADVPRVQQRLRKASQAGKQSLYAALDARLRFEVGERKVYITGSLAGLCGTSTCPRGDLNPLDLRLPTCGFAKAQVSGGARSGTGGS